MSRCQHNEKITKFCITPNCNHPVSGGCEYCFKRYHCHIGEAKSLKEEEALSILKQITAFDDKKTKIRPFKQAIYNYFNIIKGQLSTYIDCMSSDLLNRITFPYVRKEGNMNIVKKLKHKEYSKLTTEEMVKLVEFRNNNPPQKLQIKQIQAYFDETQQVHKKVLAINNLYKQFQKQTQDSYLGQAIMSVGIYYKKIIEILDHVEAEKSHYNKTQQNHIKKEDLKLNLHKVTPENKDEQSPIKQIRKNQVEFKYDIKTKNNEQINSKLPSIESEQVSKAFEEQKQLPTKKQNRQRKLSIDSRCNDLISHSRLKSFEQKEKEISERRQKLDEILAKKQKTKRVSQSSASSSEKQQSMLGDTSDKINTSSMAQSNVKSTISNDQNQNQMIAHTLLPEGKDERKLYDQFQTVQKKTLKIPVNVIQQNAEGEQCQSPILKLRKNERPKQNHGKSSGFEPGLFKLQQTQRTTPSQSEQPHSSPINNAPELSSRSSSEASDKQNIQPVFPVPTQINISEKETNSIFLLAESLKLSAKKAIPLLQAALKYAPHNFSAAEYLSYLLLQQNKPKECLKVCNQALKLISGEPNSMEISFHLYNNKAAALNLLGRFSQSIPILEKCIEVKKKDVFYKNLGDSYFNLGIIQKAIINYENALIMNDDNHQALYNLGVCLYLQKNYDSSKLKVQQALMLDHENQIYLELYKKIAVAIQEQKAR